MCVSISNVLPLALCNFGFQCVMLIIDYSFLAFIDASFFACTVVCVVGQCVRCRVNGYRNCVAVSVNGRVHPKVDARTRASNLFQMCIIFWTPRPSNRCERPFSKHLQTQHIFRLYNVERSPLIRRQSRNPMQNICASECSVLEAPLKHLPFSSSQREEFFGRRVNSVKSDTHFQLRNYKTNISWYFRSLSISL